MFNFVTFLFLSIFKKILFDYLISSESANVTVQNTIGIYGNKFYYDAALTTIY